MRKIIIIIVGIVVMAWGMTHFAPQATAHVELPAHPDQPLRIQEY